MNSGFQLVWPLLAPLGDAEFIWSIWHGNIHTGLVSYTLFLMLDLVASTVAFRLDRRPARSLWTLLIQRFYYRQFMYFVAFAAVLRAIRGSRERWNKLERRGSMKGIPGQPDFGCYPATALDANTPSGT